MMSTHVRLVFALAVLCLVVVGVVGVSVAGASGGASRAASPSVSNAADAGSSPVLVDDKFAADTEAYLSRLEKLGFAGVVLVAKGGEPVLAEGYGLANREQETEWSPRTASTIGSITKQFTAAGIMALQEQGKLRVEDKLGDHFTDVPDDKAGITLHQLLTQSSGIVDPPGIDDFDDNTRDEYVRAVLDAPLAFEPGERFEYANANFSLLGAIIEMQTGKSYESAMRELIFEPAGLEETGYTGPAWEQGRLAQGYQGDERWGTVLERPMADDGPFWALRANGGIYSTSLDMLRWAEALLDDRVLSRTSRDAMWSPHVDETGDGESFYGYGWVHLKTDAGVPIITHNGGNRILFADFAIVPDHDLVVFLQTNVVADFRPADRLIEEMLQRAFQKKPYPEVPEVVEMDLNKLEHWVGTYVLDNGDKLDITLDGAAIRVRPTGWHAYAVVHSMPEQRVDALVGLSREIDRIVGAYVDGDFQPLYDAYRQQAPIERLQHGWAERQREREAQYGKFKGYDVIGTGTGESYHFTSVRFDYERDHVLRTYVWSRDETPMLLGITTRRMEPTCRFYPVAGGGFQSWEPATGASVRARLDAVPDFKAFIVERDGAPVMAKR